MFIIRNSLGSSVGSLDFSLGFSLCSSLDFSGISLGFTSGISLGFTSGISLGIALCILLGFSTIFSTTSDSSVSLSVELSSESEFVYFVQPCASIIHCIESSQFSVIVPFGFLKSYFICSCSCFLQGKYLLFRWWRLYFDFLTHI